MTHALKEKIMTEKKLNSKEFVGWCGLAMLQSSAIPATIHAIETGQSAPIATISMTILGLCCYMYRAIKDKDKLYMCGNLIGIGGNTTLLIFVF